MPQTVSKGLEVPNTGDFPGTWGEDAINPDMVAIDGMLGGFASISLSSSNVTLTKPAGYTATPGAGPTQSQNAMLVFSGTLTGAVTVTFPLPGFYIVNNLCAVGSHYVRLGSSNPGKYVCAPPGEAIHVFNDGTDMHYVNLGRVGEYLDLAASAVPAWITNCTVPPYLLCDGSTFDSGVYPQLAAQLGGTTLPDARGRARFALDGGQNRVTSAGSGVDGATLFAAGGSQFTQEHNHNLNFNDPGHFHTYATPNYGNGASMAGSGAANQTVGNTQSKTTGITISLDDYGTGDSQNMPPAYIGGITLIRAA